MPETTSHLICAPEFDEIGHVVTIHVTTGDWAVRDGALVTLALPDGEVVVVAPDTGSISSLLIEVGEEITSGELLLMMEIEEQESGWLPLDLPPACSALPVLQASSIASADVLQVTRDAASLAARLGVDLSEIMPTADGVIDRADVERYVRQRLARD
ncbi:hypothetical protein [Andreprevotia chitinilytica]|uniref:hypothetical protein n=1 Tax=Andreprevotia chitinilytica TaxID=396808 RepID=UPI000555BC2D|nr:hypothetical protein [Andreprevotia chitinilytica]